MNKVERWIEVECPDCGMDHDLDDLSFWCQPTPSCCSSPFKLNMANFHIKVGNTILFVSEEEYRKSFDGDE